MGILLRFLASAIALYLTVWIGRALGLHLYLAPGAAGVTGALIAAVILGVANAVARPILKLAALPITCATLGLFSVVINAFLFWGTGQITPGYHVKGALAAVFGTVVMGLTGGIVNSLLLSGREKLGGGERERQKR